MKILGTKGDTIVEVLLCMAVVSAVLGATYVSANRSLNGSRQSQEHSEVIKLLEGQLELLKASSDSAIFSDPPPFCMHPTTGAKAAPPACDVITPAVTYAISINRSDNTFVIKATWDRVRGNSTEEAKLVYRLYPR